MVIIVTSISYWDWRTFLHPIESLDKRHLPTALRPGAFRSGTDPMASTVIAAESLALGQLSYTQAHERVSLRVGSRKLTDTRCTDWHGNATCQPNSILVQCHVSRRHNIMHRTTDLSIQCHDIAHDSTYDTSAYRSTCTSSVYRG